MPTREEIKEGIKEFLSDELILHNITHEIPPPSSNCLEECGVVDMHAGILVPVRSGGKKHKKCMDCWNEYIEGLTTRLFECEDKLGVVIKVDRELPSIFDADGNVISALEYKKKLEGFVAVESLVEEE